MSMSSVPARNVNYEFKDATLKGEKRHEKYI